VSAGETLKQLQKQLQKQLVKQLATYDLCAVGREPAEVNNQEARAAVLYEEDQTRTATAVERHECSLANRALQGYRVRRLAWHTPTGSPYPFMKEAQPSLEALNRESP
jgi:hypothetical protein